MADINLTSIAAGTGGFVINGESAGDLSGVSVASAGDVNGDGLADLIIGAKLADPAGRTDGGRSYVVFGKSGTTTIELPAIAAGLGGFAISGTSAGDFSGISVAAAGDVNGDGLADLIVGAHYADAGTRTNAGRSYVVFGKKNDTAAVDLASVASGLGGFVIEGASEFFYSGISVSGAGDVNGDGLADLVVGAYWATLGVGGQAGTSYVVFGQTGTTAIDLAAVAAGTGGFAINGQTADDRSGRSVSSAGDVNGDGLADLLVGAYGNDAAGGDAGRSYVVFGRTDTATIELSAVANGTGGFVINGECSGEWSGRNVSGAGDVNGDGLADVVIGAMNVGPGRSYVVFGKTGTTAVELSAVSNGTGGFVITGEAANDASGFSVAGAGDVNGDGLADLIVSSPGNDAAAGIDSGRTYVVFGKSGTTAVQLSEVAGGIGGFVINGECSSDVSGSSVSAAGDVNGDGLADLIVGSASVDPSGRIDAGRTYVIFGSTTGAFSSTAVDQLGDSDANTLSGSAVAETLVGGAGNDTLTGGGGADVLQGGSGNDTINVNASNVAALVAGITSGQLARIDGGSGIDTLALSGTGITLDLTVIANQGAGTPGSTSRIESIERVSIVGGNTLTLGVKDVIDMAGMNLLNATTSNGLGWVDSTLGGGTYAFAASEDRHQLVVHGGSGDVLNLQSDAWVALGSVFNADEFTNYIVYNSVSGRAQVLASSTMTRNVTTPYIALSAVAAGTGGFVIDGQCTADASGTSVASAGDVNGDGLADLIVGAPYADPLAPGGGSAMNFAGRSYVVFGKSGAATVELSDVAAGTGGFVIHGQCAGDYSGIAVSGAGDVNGDGLADVIVGAMKSDPAAGSSAGRTYVVFGKTGTTAVEASAVAAGTGGFVINGQSTDDFSGRSVSAAGDVNGDGLGDLLVGASFADPVAGSNAGRSYVIYGRTSTSAVDLSAVAAGTGGFVIHGECSGDGSGFDVANAGDVNGDGLADLIVGAPESTVAATVGAGRSYVVFGKTDTTSIFLATIAVGSGGFVIDGQAAFEGTGTSVAAAGDVNGDGLGDLIVGAPQSDPATGTNAGRSYVVFGKTGTNPVALSQAAAGTGGFVITGESGNDQSGTTVASAGDMNGDGLADLIVTAKLADPAGFTGSGRTYVVFGTTGTTAVALSDVAIGIGGFALNGELPLDASGTGVAAAGDVSGDGLADLIVGAPGVDLSGRGNAGRSYVVFGSTTGVFASTAVDQMGNSGDNALTGSASAETLVGGSGNDTLTGNGGADVLYGGNGNDTFVVTADTLAALAAAFGASGNDAQLARIDGGGGTDSLVFSGTVYLDLGALSRSGGDAPGSASRIESIERIDMTGNGDNTLSLTPAAVYDLSDVAGTLKVDGNEGDMVFFSKASGWTSSVVGDYNQFVKGTAVLQFGSAIYLNLTGDASADSLQGTPNADMLDGLTGSDQLRGLGGNDSYNVDTQGDLVFESLNEGIDTVFSTASFYLYANIEYLILLTGSAVFGVGNNLANQIIGNDQENLLIGWDGADSLYGGEARDALYGVDGDDLIYGQEGIDYIVAGTGNDTIYGGDNADEAYGQEGHDVMYGGDDFATDILVGGDGNDTIDGGPAWDLMYGNDGDDTFYVSQQVDWVFEVAGQGTDTVIADSPNGYYLFAEIENLTLVNTTPFGVGNVLANVITGNAIANSLLGGGGNDTLNGGAGNDILWGESGNDTFVFQRDTDIDVIGDFTPGADKLKLLGVGYSSYANVQSHMVQNGGTTAIDLGLGDIVILQGVAMASLSAGDFLFA